MKSVSFAVSALLASVAVAQPHRHHQAFHQKRDAPVVWVTDYDYVTETIDYTTTIWVSSGFVPPTPSTSSAASSSANPVPAQFFEPAPSAPSVPTTSSSSSVYVAPTPVSTYVAPTSAEAPAYVAPVQSSSTPVAAPAPASTQEAPVVVAPYVAPTPSPSSPAAAPTPAPVATSAPSSGSGSSSGGQCSSGSPCTGDITYYDTGMGACGWNNDGTTERVVALPHELMGTQSNGNPFCGKTITITRNGKSTIAKVVDKCMGCVGTAIDLSDAAFMDLADMSLGRTTASWYFN